MDLDAQGSARGLTILWNPLEVVFQDWLESPRIMTGRFRYLGKKELVALIVVYCPPISRKKSNFWEDFVS